MTGKPNDPIRLQASAVQSSDGGPHRLLLAFEGGRAIAIEVSLPVLDDLIERLRSLRTLVALDAEQPREPRRH